jgi:hypothetical protein
VNGEAQIEQLAISSHEIKVGCKAPCWVAQHRNSREGQNIEHTAGEGYEMIDVLVSINV